LGLPGCIKPFANHPARLADGTNSHTRAAGFDPNDISGLPFGFFWHGLLPEISVIASSRFSGRGKVESRERRSSKHHIIDDSATGNMDIMTRPPMRFI
jgi:hypothetical protein